MSLLQKITISLKQIPTPVKSFLFRAFLFFIIWEFLYNIFLLPNRIIDRPLCSFVGNCTAEFINAIKGTDLAYCKTVTSFDYNEGELYITDRAIVYLGANRLIGIADGCNGLNLFVLFIGFIFVYPGDLKFKFIYSIIGIILITLLNILRCAALGLIHNSYPQFTDFAHHYAFKLITYLVIFYLWHKYVKFINKLEISHA
jgi:exosortase/archaeosortase family protein